METLNECSCLAEEPSIDLSLGSAEENEDLEEIDKDELIEDEHVSHRIIWDEISDNFHKNRQAVVEYQSTTSLECQVKPNPAVELLDVKIFTILLGVLKATINEAQSLECISHQKTAFNGIDFIAEHLYNLNPLFPTRKDEWLYIFDMEWVKLHLEKYPRPYYPFSWIWSKEYAATIIQAGVRAYWVRRRENVQEMRQFWKIIKSEREQENIEKEQENIENKQENIENKQENTEKRGT